ncbi:MAG: sigma 54-interacting transcriptional regulator [Candidatus Edwardsbacteria bacterium]
MEKNFLRLKNGGSPIPKNWRKEAKALIFGRPFLYTLFLGTGIVFYRSATVSVTPLIVLSLSSYLLTVIYWLFTYLPVPFFLQAYSQIFLDIILISTTIHYTGGIDSSFSLLYFLVVIISAALLLVKGGLYGATLSTVAFALITRFEFQILVHSEMGKAIEILQSDLTLRVCLYGISFYLIGLLAGLLAERVRQREIELTQKELVIEEIKFSTDEILKQLGSGVLTLNNARKIVYLNQAAERILGIAGLKLNKTNLKEVFTGRLSEFGNKIEEILENGMVPLKSEITVFNENGVSIPLGLGVDFIFDSKTQKRGTVILFQDLTEKKKLELQLREAERLAEIGELATGLAREIGLSVNSIRNLLQLISEKSNLPLERRQSMEVISKEIEKVHRIINDLLNFAKLELPELVTKQDGMKGEIIGQSQNFLEVWQMVERVADSESTILIYGESGTGKELIAKEIHHRSQRKDAPFVSINCAALPESLLESELFGHIRGSFTGALKDKDGLFKVADGGTFFLDEVSETSPAIQVKLLRVLQEKEVVPVGGTKPIKVDVRIISATNRNLEKEVEMGKFRADLFYRLNVIPLNLPPLRERKKDISLLAEFFVKRYCQKLNVPLKKISKEAIEKLCAYQWPGNVRELENVVERAVVLERGRIIDLQSLPEEIRKQKEWLEEPFSLAEENQEKREGFPRKGILREREREEILHTLEASGWNKTLAAAKLGIHYTTLFRKMRNYGIKSENRRKLGEK